MKHSLVLFFLSITAGLFGAGGAGGYWLGLGSVHAAIPSKGVSVPTPVVVQSAWVRATVPGQTSTAAYMELRSDRKGILMVLGTSASRLIQIHRTEHIDDVIRMRFVSSIPLSEEGSVVLRPGGLHLMLEELKQPLQEGKITVRLRFIPSPTSSDPKPAPIDWSADFEIRKVSKE